MAGVFEHLVIFTTVILHPNPVEIQSIAFTRVEDSLHEVLYPLRHM